MFELPTLGAYLAKQHTRDLFRLETLPHYRATSGKNARLTDKDLAAQLVAELRGMRFDYASWKHQLRSGTARRQRANLPLEANAALVQVFVPDMVPGLLQTAEYARHVFARLVNLHGIPNETAGMDTITLAIIPFTATLPVVPSHAFTMFDDTLVLVETIGAELAFKATGEKALYADVFERLWKVGVQNDNAATLISTVIEELPK